MLKLSGMAVSSTALAALAQQAVPADYSLDIAPYDLEVAPRRSIKKAKPDQDQGPAGNGPA